MIRIISKKSPRLEYITAYLSSRIGIKIDITSSHLSQNPADQIRISYADKKELSSDFHIPSSGLLFQKDINQQLYPKCNQQNGLLTLFPSESDNGFSFDVFSAIFYCLTRYEEYGTIEKDEHGRFRGTQSHAVKYNYIDQPIVDQYVSFFKTILKRLKPELHFSAKQYSIQPTIDIDHAYAYLNKSKSRTLLSGAKNIVKRQTSVLKNKRKVFTNEAKDPFDTFEYLKKHLICEDLLEPIFFILMSNENAFDSSNDLQSTMFIRLLRDLQNHYEVGMHPSYNSDKNLQAISSEKTKLELLLNQTIHQSRQHFLKLSFPKTYRQLIQEGITKDYSMGYHDIIGFRAGTCFPFQWYDLEKDEETALEIYPFQIMDVTLKQYMKLTPDEAIQAVQNIKKIVSDYEGTFQFIWHNSSFYEQEGWAGWKAVFQNIIKNT